MSPAPDVPLDGRLARSHRTRHAIIAGMRDLHRDGDLRPTARKIADRAGVSVRTVWQHFDDLETLFVEATRIDTEVARSYARPIDGGAPLPERVDLLLEQRFAMYEACAPTWRAARMHEPVSRTLMDNRRRMVANGRQQVAAAFAAELLLRPEAARQPLVEALTVTTGWDLWESLTSDQGLPPETVRAVVDTMLTALLRDPAA